MKETPKGCYDFEITIKYKDDKDLDDIINEEILQEAWTLADYRNCFTDDTYVDALDGSERSW